MIGEGRANVTAKSSAEIKWNSIMLRRSARTTGRDWETRPVCMGDEDNNETFETADAGSSHTYPMEGGQIRKGGHIMIKGRPCKVSDVSTSKTGKHGHAKCHFVAIDIFTGKKMEDLVPSSHTTSVPFVKKEEFQCMDVDDDGFVTVLSANGETRSDLKLPVEMQPEPPGARELSDKIKQLLADEADFYVIVQSACGHEQIMDIKMMTNNS
ncbi:hypothetical protein AB1Y20_016830 [Prymnesium parvum]|uniref:Translation initiation factor 5A C-terminal domain-containing protein n=1 Tax=Prymnesium parvum TaxID=97485 RepID=A0AB34IC86_PRYPA